MAQPDLSNYGKPVKLPVLASQGGGVPDLSGFGKAVALPPAGPRRTAPTSSGAAQEAIDRGLAMARSRELDAIANARQDQPAPVVEPRVRGRSTMADFSTPMQLPDAGPEPTQQQPLRQVVPHPMRVQQVTPGERFAAHAGEAFQGTIAGQAAAAYRGGERFARQAEQLDKIIHYAESQDSKVALPLPAELSAPDPLTGIVSPSGSDPNKDAQDTLGMPFVGKRLEYLRQLRRDAEAAYGPAHAEEVRRQNIRQFKYQTTPGAKSPLDVGAAVAGELAGGLPTPESLVPVTRGPTLLRTFARGAIANGVTNLLADPAVQMAQIRMGTRKEFDPAQTFLGAAGGAFLGGTLNVAPEVASNIARAVGQKLGKAADKVTNSDVWQAMTTWVRSPDTLPADLKVEPRFQSAPDFTGDAAGNVRATAGTAQSPEPASTPTASAPDLSRHGSPVYREHVAPTAPQQAPAQSNYQGGIMGPPFSKLTPEAAKATAAISEPASGNVVVTPRGRRVGVEYQVVDAGMLVPSHTTDMRVNPQFPAALQPRQRERVASQAQIAEMAAKLEPELLGRSASSAEGAPIVGPDNVVESGNARTLAIQRAYNENLPGAQRYRAWLQGQGYDVSGMARPVLIRRRTTDLLPQDRQAFTREANERTTLAMGAGEQAKADAAAMPDWLVTDTYKGGDIGAGVNAPFVRKFADLMVPPSERGAFFSGAGQLSQEGRRRVENALFAKAYGDAGILANLRENPDVAIKSIGDAMIEAAPSWSQLRADIAGGRVRPEMDITPALVDAVRLVDRARQQGVPVSNLVNQVDMLSGQVSPEVKAALGILYRDAQYRRAASKPQVAQALKFYAEQARHVQTAGGLDLGGSPVTPANVLSIAKGRGTGELMPDAAEQRGVMASQRPDLSRHGAPVQAAGVQAMTPGANYVGAVPQVYNPAAVATGEPIGRENILRDFIAGMGIPVYKGRIKSKQFLGFFRPSVHEVRIRNANDLETTAHEMAHYLDKLLPIIRRQWWPANKANAAVRAELAGVSYDAKKLYEGFAEYVRLFMTQKNQAAAKAPIFNAWFERFLNQMAASGDAKQVSMAAAIRKAQGEMHDWFVQPALNRAASKIGGDPDINAGLVRGIDRFRQSVTDDLHGIANMERGLTGKISPVGAYETARLTRAAASITEGALTLGRPVVNPDGSHSFVGKGLDQILDPVKHDLDNALLYFIGRSARETMGQGRERLFSQAEIKAMLALDTPERRTAFAEYQEWNKAILDFAQAKGAIDPQKRAMWRRAEYLPFYRVTTPGPARKASAGAAPGDWRGIKALTGGTENLRPVLSNMIQNAHTLISAGLTNEARQEVAALASRPGGALFMAKIPKDDKRILIMKAEMERAILEALGVRSKQALPIDQQIMVDQIIDGLEPMTALFTRGNAPKGNDIVAVLHGGKPTYYEVADPVLYRAISALNRPMRGSIMKWLSLPKRIGQTTVTLTIDFMARNIFRDTIMGAIMSRHGFRPFADSAIGFKNRITRDQTYREFLANGGGLGSHLLDETHYRKHLERFITRKGIDYKTVLDAPDKLMFALGRIAEAFEQATRLGEYRRAIQRGEHPRHAAYSSREVSTDFAMRGDSEYLGFLYDTVVFLKAAVNGLDRLGRGLVEDPNRGKIAAGVGLIALASMGLYAVNRGNPLYEQIEDWDKNTYWHLFIPTPAYFAARARGKTIPPAEAYYHFRLPKLWEIGAIGSIAERQLEGILNGQPLEAQTQTGKILLSQFNVNLPQIIQPAAELVANRDFFTGRPIENQADKGLLPFARSDAYTSSTLRKLGEAERNLPPSMQVSPKVIEHLLHGYFNTWATYGLNALDWATTDKLPTPRLDRLPVVSTFYRQEPAQSTRYVTQLYDAIEAATQARQTMKAMARRWEPEIAQEQAAKPENLMYRQMTFAEKRMQEFRKAATLATDAPDLATVRQMLEARATATKNLHLMTDARRAWGSIGDLKRLLVDEITRERNAFAETVMKGVQARQENPKATGTGP